MYFIFGVKVEKSEVLFGELQQLKREFETVQEADFLKMYKNVQLPENKEDKIFHHLVNPVYLLANI